MVIDENLESATFSWSRRDRNICDSSARVEVRASPTPGVSEEAEATSATLSSSLRASVVLLNRWPSVSKWRSLWHQQEIAEQCTEHNRVWEVLQQ